MSISGPVTTNFSARRHAVVLFPHCTLHLCVRSQRSLQLDASTAERACRRLVDRALAAGGRDNVTVVAQRTAGTVSHRGGDLRSESSAVRIEEVQSGGVGSYVDVIARAERDLGAGYGNHPSAIGPDMHDLRSPE